MPVPAAKKRYQNTTVRLPRHVYERAKTVAVQSQAASFNEFVVQAIEEKVRRLSEAEIDAAFAQMANDEEYQHSSIVLARRFEQSDWEAFRSGAARDRAQQVEPQREQPKTRASKTRPW
ncbi:MAG TPA: hypothetical protein VMD99_03180 [Terriglobales bacterium]|nr:hypothetical protein [Terriglobales bacterium]